MSPADRFILLDGILNSLDEPDKTIQQIWAVEAEKRLNAYKEGRLKTIPYEEVFGHVRNPFLVGIGLDSQERNISGYLMESIS